MRTCAFRKLNHHANYRGLSQAAQYVPLRSRQPARLRTPPRTPARRRARKRLTAGCCTHRPRSPLRFARATADLAFHRVYQALYSFATTDLSSVLFRLFERPALHRSPSLPRPARSAQTALYRIHYALGAPGRPAAGLHGRGSLGRDAPARRRAGPASTSPNSPTRPSCCRSERDDDALLLELGGPAPVRNEVLKTLERGPHRRLIGARSKPSSFWKRPASGSTCCAVMKPSCQPCSSSPRSS